MAKRKREKYYYCRKCRLTIHESDVTEDADGAMVHPMRTMSFDLPMFHEVIEEP